MQTNTRGAKAFEPDNDLKFMLKSNKSRWQLKGLTDANTKPIYGIEKLAEHLEKPILITRTVFKDLISTSYLKMVYLYEFGNLLNRQIIEKKH